MICGCNKESPTEVEGCSSSTARHSTDRGADFEKNPRKASCQGCSLGVSWAYLEKES